MHLTDGMAISLPNILLHLQFHLLLDVSNFYLHINSSFILAPLYNCNHPLIQYIIVPIINHFLHNFQSNITQHIHQLGGLHEMEGDKSSYLIKMINSSEGFGVS